MPTPFKRITKISSQQQLLAERDFVITTAGRAPVGGVLDHPAGRPGHDRRPRGDRDDANFNPDGSRKDGHERKPRFKVELLCRTFAGDVGLRPLPNMVFWESPDIAIEGPAGDPDVATPGVVNTVNVHVWNLGLADCWSAHVDLYWCDPSVGINPAVANPIGSQVISLAAGQHAVVPFHWTPVLANGGHECLVAQVYDPVSDPIVAPFNPVQDRHVGQRNITVLQTAPNRSLDFAVFSQNLSFGHVDTLLEVQKVEGEALAALASALGRRPWNAAGGQEVELSPPTIVDLRPHPQARALATGVFREALQEVPTRSENRQVTHVLRTLVAPRKARELNAGSGNPRPATDAAAAAAKLDHRGDVQWVPATRNQVASRLRLPPGRRVRFSLRIALPAGAERQSADVWRIVEHTAGRITGGVTIIVQAK